MKVAFAMKLRPGCSEEYKKRHDAIWPEISQLLKQNGISNYYIFLQETTNTLFAVQDQYGTSSQELGSENIMQKWWEYMSGLMETNIDLSPKTEVLKELFCLL